MRHPKCDLCGKPGKTHRKANFGRGKKGKSALKVPKKKEPHASRRRIRL